MSGPQIDRLIAALDSLKEGDLAVDMLIACGPSAIAYLADFLLKGSPRTIAVARCRAVRALGGLGARTTLIAYFRDYERPSDSAVLFAEDAVRSAAARELARWNCEEVFEVLLDAAAQRITGGLAQALGEFRRPESIPLLFHVLEDDLCRQEAMNSLRRQPEAARQFAILSIRGLTAVTLDGPSARCRQRAVVQLLSELHVTRHDWPDLVRFLSASDPATVVAAAKIGFLSAPEDAYSEIATALLRAAERPRFALEEEVEQLLDAHPEVARKIALEIAKNKKDSGEKPNWLLPSWRILNHLLGRSLESGRSGRP
jgi:hypothetical protein